MQIVSEFESAFATKIGSRYAIAVNSGTSALHTALAACPNIKGGEVIMPALCPAMDAFAIIQAGAIPVFADVDPDTGLITAQTIRDRIARKTVAVIAVHLHGLPCDMEPIVKLCEPRASALWLIEDCAQALLARYKDRHAGTYGNFGCFSFEKKKHMTTGSEGGMIVSNDPVLATNARKFAGIGYKHMTAEAGRTSLNASDFQRPYYERFDTIGLNYRMSEIQAEIGLRNLASIDEVIKRRQQIGYMWQHALGFQCQPHTYDADNTFYSAAYDFGDDWIGFYNRFVEAGGDGFYAMPKVPYQEPALSGRWPVSCPIAEGLQQRLMLYKTHYSIDKATRQVEILHDLIRP